MHTEVVTKDGDADKKVEEDEGHIEVVDKEALVLICFADLEMRSIVFKGNVIIH